MSSLLDHLDSNQSENDDIHLLFPKCKPRASSVGTESQSSESQSNSQQYLADNFPEQNLNHQHNHHLHLQHHPSSVSVSSAVVGGGGGNSSSSARQSSRRHSSSGFTHHQHQQQRIHSQQQQLPDNLLKHSKHSSYPPLLTAEPSSTGNSGSGGNATYIGHGSLSPYDNNNLTHDNKSHHHQQQHQNQYQSSSRQQHHHQHLQQQQQQSDSSDNFPLTPSFNPSSHYNSGNTGGGVIINSGNNSSSNSKKVDGYNHNHSSVGSVKSHHHHSRSKNSISSRNSRHEAATAAALISAGGPVTGSNTSQGQQGGGGRYHSRSSHNHHHSSTLERERPHHHHRNKKSSHMTESSSYEPISCTAAGNKVNSQSSSHRYTKSQRESNCGGGGGPTKSYSTLSLGSGMECEPLDDPHHHHYDDGFNERTRCSRNLAANSNGASSYNSEHSSATRNSGNGGGCLRDSRIEIAGGREIYSQNRIRAGRRLRGSSSTSSSTEMMADSSMSITASSSSSAGAKHTRKKSPNMQQQVPIPFTNGDIVDGGDLSVWEPKHRGKPYQENTLPPRSSHHHHSSGSGHRHHHHQHHQHHQQQQHHSHDRRNRHVCGYSHCDHPKLLSPTDINPTCGGHGSIGGSGPTSITVKETVFSSEVTSIDKPIEPDMTIKSGAPAAAQAGNMQPPYVYETSVVNSAGGEIIFDDIGGGWNRGEGGHRSGRRNSSATEGGLCLDRPRKDGMKRSPSTGHKRSMQGINFFHNGSVGESEMHCCSSLEQMEHSGSSMNASSAPTVLLQGSPSPSTRGGNTTPSGYESDEYSGMTPVSLNMLGSGGKGCMPNNRLMGALPIAEYEGSPKRYGLRQPTHPMPTHLDLVDVDIQMNSGTEGNGGAGPSDLNSGGGATHQISLMSPSQPNCKPTVPTSASSSSSSSLDNTNTNSNISSTSSNRNLYGNRISPRIISPSQSISNFPSRVPGFPQRITPVTSSLDSSSLVDSGLEKSEATDIRSDSVLEREEADVLIETSTATTCHQNSINNDESPRDPIMKGSQEQQQHHQYYYTQQLQQKSVDGGGHNFRSSDNDEPPPSSNLCQGQLVNSEREHSSDLLLTDQLNIEGEKCNPSSTTNLCGNPLDDTEQQMHQPHKPQYHNMVLELVDSGPVVVAAEDHHQSLQQQNIILSGTTTAASIQSAARDKGDDQCLISVPSSSSETQNKYPGSEIAGEGASDVGNSLIGIGGGANSSTDYLYEFSETRKVLEEFFGGNNGGGNSSAGGACGLVGGSSAGGFPSISGNSGGLDGPSLNMNQHGPFFDELDYTLKRQTGNSYVGQRLAGESCTAVEESPKKPTRRGVLLLGSSDGDGGEGGDAASPRLISFQEITLPQALPGGQKGGQNPPRDLNDNDIDGDSSSTNTETDNLGDTEVGLQVGLSRNFTLSPETTDCDSNELESEISLDYEASLHSSSRVGVSMPTVEDGLSSGNVSDTEEIVPEQLSNDLKRTGASQQHQQQGLLLANNTNPNPNSNNLIGGGGSRQLSNNYSSIGGGGLPHQRREQHHHSQNPSGHHHHHHHHQHHHHHNQHHLLDDELACYGTEQEDAAAAGVSLSPSVTSALPVLQAASLQHPPVSPSATSSASSTANAKISSEPNPTLLLMKKQISEIEKEIKMRASQQNQKMQLQQHHHHLHNHHHSVENSNSNTHNNSVMSVSDVTEGSNTPNNNGGSATNLPSMNNSSSTNGGSSCVTSNGNGLASQLNVSSCPDVSTLSSATGISGGGQGSCYTQQQHHPTPNGNCAGDPSLPLVSTNSLQNTSSSAGAGEKGQETTNFDSIDIELEALDPMRPTPPPSPAPSSMVSQMVGSNNHRTSSSSIAPPVGTTSSAKAAPINIPTVSGLPGRIPNSANAPSNCTASTVGDSTITSGISPDSSSSSSSSVAAAIQDIKEAIQRTKTLPRQQQTSSVSLVEQTSRPSPLTSTSQQSHADSHNSDTSPVWVPRQGASSYHHHRSSGGGGGVKDPLLRKQRYDETPDDDADTDQETDRLLGQTRTEDDYGFYDEKEWKKVKNCRSLLPALNKGVSFVKSAASGSVQPLGLSSSASSLNAGGGGSGGGGGPSLSSSSNNHGLPTPNFSSTSNLIAPSSARISPAPFKQQEQPLPSTQLNSNNSSSNNAANSVSNKPKKDKDGIKKKRSKEDFKNPSVLIEGVLFRARYLGSTQLVCEGQPTKATRMMQAEEAVSRIKTVDQTDLSSETEQHGACTAVSDSGGGEPFHQDTSTSTTAPASSTTATTTTTTSTSADKREHGQPGGPQFEDYLYAEDDDSGDESCAESEFFHKTGHHHSIQSPTSSARSFQGPCFGGTSSPVDTAGTGAPHFGPACGSALPGTMFRLKFVGSLEVDEEVGSGKRRRKRPKKTMVEEAVFKMKAPEGETQPSTEVDLFISTEKIMVLNTDLKEIMMDHALRTISYIADIGDLVVLMARRRPVPSDTPDDSKIARPPKMICHVFESDEAQYIAQSIGQAFQVAYMEFLKANGIEDQSFVREMDYQEVLNSQEIFGDELQMFAKKELQKEVVVPKSKGEILGVVIVESGWGSMLPTVVIANLAPAGAAARCGQLNIGDQIIAINGVSLVGLPLSTCQTYIKNTKTQTVVKLTVVPCPPVVEVKIKRPDTKYQLGFSVQNGVICSLLRGGIAERGGVRVGHRIIEINGQSVVAVPHEKIVNLLATSVGEINMKTMPTSMFRLLTGQETPLYI